MESVSTKQRRIAQVAHKYREVTTLAHHMDIHWLWEAYRRVNRQGASGVDGMSLGDYEEDLMENLKGLLQRMKSGRYQAPPVRRAGAKSWRPTPRSRRSPGRSSPLISAATQRPMADAVMMP